MNIRFFKEADTEAVVSLFYDTVHAINKRDYSQAELDAWAPKKNKACFLILWKKSLKENIAYVAELNGSIIGFGDITSSGYLNRLYVSPFFQRKQVASALLNQLEFEMEKLEVPVITTDASITARPFFERHGYKTICAQTVERSGIALTNYQMSKQLKS